MQEPTISRGDTVMFTLDKHHLAVLPHHNNGLPDAPAIVTRVYDGSRVNLKVLCDDDADLWVTSAERGDKPGQWRSRPL